MVQLNGRRITQNGVGTLQRKLYIVRITYEQ